MAVIKEGNLIKTKKELKEFVDLKLQSIDDLEWCKWAGWMDTDGTLFYKNKTEKRVSLKLKDRQPVELLSNLFETSLIYLEHKTITPEPYRYEYIAKEYITNLNGQRAVAIAKNIYPYLLNREKKERAIAVLGYAPESKKLDDWTKQEFVQYLATAFEGDGSVNKSKTGKKSGRFLIDLRMKSSNVEYLSTIKYLFDKHFGVCCSLTEHSTYKTKKGIKTKYDLFFPSRIKEFFHLLVEPNVMTLDRKKNKIVEYLNQ